MLANRLTPMPPEKSFASTLAPTGSQVGGFPLNTRPDRRRFACPVHSQNSQNPYATRLSRLGTLPAIALDTALPSRRAGVTFRVVRTPDDNNDKRNTHG
ncbi:hypothetical protein [Pseudomonas nicosulfuronedens]